MRSNHLVVLALLALPRFSTAGDVTEQYLKAFTIGLEELDRGNMEPALDDLSRAFELAPQAAYLPRRLVDHGLRDSLISRARLEADPVSRPGVVALLAAIEPDVAMRLEHRRQLAAQFPENVHYHVWQGVAALRQSLSVHDRQEEMEIEAVDSFVRAIKLQPADDRGYEGLVVWVPGRGTLYQRYSERVPAALHQVLRAFHALHCALRRQAPEDPKSAGSVHDLIDSSRSYLAEVPAVQAQFVAGLLEIHVGNPREAVARMAQVESAGAPSFLTEFVKARAAMDLGQDEQAHGILSQLAGAYVEPGILHNLAVSAHRLGRLPEARRRYREALTLNPTLVPSIHNLAVLDHPTDPQGARALVASGLNTTPQQKDLEGLFGWMLMEAGQSLEARLHLERACQRPDRDRASAYALARLTLAEGQIEEVRKLLTSLIMEEPLNSTYQGLYRQAQTTFIERARARASDGEVEQAREMLEEVLHDSMTDLPLQTLVTQALSRIATASPARLRSSLAP